MRHGPFLAALLVATCLVGTACGTEVAPQPGAAGATADAGSVSPVAGAGEGVGPADCALRVKEKVGEYADRPRLAADVTVRGVLVCRQSDGATVLELRADSGFERVVAALRLPDKPLEGFCAGEGLIVPPVGVITPDGVVWPQYPQDECYGLPQELQDAVYGLVPTSQRTLSLGAEAEAAQASASARDVAAKMAGCPNVYKDLIALEAESVPASAAPDLGAGELVVCIMARGGEGDTLSFLRKGSISPEDLAAGISRRGEIPAGCASEVRGVALITGDRAMVLVELGDCRRIYVNKGFLGTAGDALVTALSR